MANDNNAPDTATTAAAVATDDDGRVLVLTPTGADAAVATELLRDAGIPSEACADVPDLCARLARGAAAAVVVAEEALIGEETAGLLACLESQPAWSDVPLVVLTTADDGGLSGDRVTRLFDSAGSVTLLERPFRAATLVSVVRVALRARRRQYEVRDLLRQREEAERRFRLMADTIPQLAWMANPDGWIFWYNQRWYAYTGTTPEQMAGWGWQDVHDPNELPRVIDKWKAALAAGAPWEDTFPLRRRDGQFRWHLSRAMPLRDADGRVTLWFGTNTDVTEQRQTARALAEQAEALEALNRIGHTIAAELDLPALVQAVTDAATRACGAQFGAFFHNVTNDRGESYMLYTISGVPREHFSQFPMPRNTEVFAPTFAGEGTVRSDDITQDPRYGKNAPRRGMPDGHLPVRSYLAVPVVGRSGEVIGGLFFGHAEPGRFTPLHERIVEGIAVQAAIAMDNARLYESRRRLLDSERAARAEAERASQLKDEFLATLSHELRTPLNAILGWAQLLRRQYAPSGDADLAEGLDVIERNTRVQVRLIEDLLDMSRIISGKLRLDVQRVDLRDVIQAVVASVRPAAEAKGVRLQSVLDPLAGPVRGDPSRLQQVVWNLLSNAIKFTDRGGRVQVSLERVNSHLEITVADTGKGIKPEFLPHVFDRFRQADASTTRQFGGLGLGLAIVKHLAELHGGTVRATSPGEGRGATFVVELPLLIVHPPADGDLREHPATAAVSGEDVTAGGSIDLPPLHGVSVLVVDDEPDATRLVARVLADCGAAVTTAAGADEGLQLLSERRFDVLLSDIGMPGQDGYTFIRRVRDLPPEQGGRTPAAALTAFARVDDRTRALRSGYQSHVAKPVEPAELAAVVASLAALSRTPG